MWIIAALLTAILWGLYYVAVGQVLKTTDKTAWLFLVSGINSLLFFFLAYSGGKLQFTLDKWLILAIIASVAGNYCTMWAIELKNPTQAALIEISYPFWCAMFSFMLLGEKLGWKSIVGAILIFLGTLIMVKE